MSYCFNTPQPKSCWCKVTFSLEVMLRRMSSRLREPALWDQSHKAILKARNNFKICLYCKINPVHSMGFDAQRKMTFPKQLTLRGRKGSNLQSGQSTALGSVYSFNIFDFRVKSQCPPLGESLEMSWNGKKDRMWQMCHLCNKNPREKHLCFWTNPPLKEHIEKHNHSYLAIPFFSGNKIYYLFAAWGQTSPASNPVQESTASPQGASTWHQIPLPE